MEKDILQKLLEVKLDSDMNALGFEYVGMVRELQGYPNAFERLHQWKNEELKLDVVTADYGNSHCEFCSLKVSEAEWPGYKEPKNNVRQRRTLIESVKYNSSSCAKDPFNKGHLLIKVVSNASIEDYEKRKLRKRYSCNITVSTFTCREEELDIENGLDEVAYLQLLLKQKTDVLTSHAYSKEEGVIYANDVIELGKILTAYTDKEYTDEELEEMVSYPYSR